MGSLRRGEFIEALHKRRLRLRGYGPGLKGFRLCVCGLWDFGAPSWVHQDCGSRTGDELFHCRLRWQRTLHIKRGSYCKFPTSIRVIKMLDADESGGPSLNKYVHIHM